MPPETTAVRRDRTTDAPRPARQQKRGPRDATIGYRRADLHEALAERESVVLPASAVTRRDLKRYYASVEDALHRAALSEDDINLLAAAATRSTFETEAEVRVLWAHVAAITEDEAHPLVQRLKGMPYGDLCAMLDVAERRFNTATVGN